MLKEQLGKGVQYMQKLIELETAYEELEHSSQKQGYAPSSTVLCELYLVHHHPNSRRQCQYRYRTPPNLSPLSNPSTFACPIDTVNSSSILLRFPVFAVPIWPHAVCGV